MSRAADDFLTGAPGALGLLLGLCGAGVALQIAMPLNHDVGWLLSAARRWLEGGALYRDTFVDVNPPLGLFLSAPVVAIGWLLGVSDATAARLCTILAGAASLLFTDRALRTLLGHESLRARLLFLAALAFAYGVLPAVRFDAVRLVGHFGQREHWMVMGWAPYLVMAAGCASGRRAASRPAAIAGVLAGLCVCLKPQFVLAIAAAELYVLFATRTARSWWRPELVALVSTGAVYIAVVFLGTPAYIEIALPLALRTYWAYQSPVFELVKRPDWMLFGVAAIAVVARRTPGPSRELCRVWFAAGIGCYFAYLAGGTAWPYHLLPYRSVVLAAAASAVLPLSARAPRGSRAMRSGAVFAGAVLIAFSAIWAFPFGVGRTLRDGASLGSGGLRGELGLLERVVDEHAPGGRILFFSSAVRPAFPLVNDTRTEWTARFSALWPLTAVVRGHAAPSQIPARIDPGELDAVEDYFLDALFEDLRERPPDLVFVGKGDRQGLRGTRLDYLEYFRRHEEFVRIWSRYHLVRVVRGFHVYKRRGTS